MKETGREIAEDVLARIGRAMGAFSMLRPGDRLAVGVSGGKDSVSLVHALSAWRRHAPFAFDMVAVTVDQGKFTSSIDGLAPMMNDIEVPWVLRKEPRTLRLVDAGVEHGCEVCSRHRRGALYRLANELGCSVLALGHTADDCAEALFRNVLFNGRIAALPPVATSRRGGMRVVRPLVYVTEAQTALYADSLGLDRVGCVCGEKAGPRGAIRAFLETMSREYHDVPESVMSALGNVNPYTLFDGALEKANSDAPVFRESPTASR